MYSRCHCAACRYLKTLLVCQTNSGVISYFSIPLMFRQVTKFGRRLRSRGTPNHDNSQSSQEITPLDTPSGSAPPDSLILSTGVDKDFFPSCISPVIQMPVPRPATPDARDAVDELASVAQQVQAGPPAGSYTERALDKQGVHTNFIIRGCLLNLYDIRR